MVKLSMCPGSAGGVPGFYHPANIAGKIAGVQLCYVCVYQVINSIRLEVKVSAETVMCAKFVFFHCYN